MSVLGKDSIQTQTVDNNSTAIQAGGSVTQNNTTNQYGLSAIDVIALTERTVESKLNSELIKLTDTVNHMLEPVYEKMWHVEQLKQYVETEVTEKLAKLPPENIVSPAPNVIAPALECLRYSGSVDELRDMFTNLIASSMDKQRSEDAHPAFVEIIKQLTAGEATFLKKLSCSELKPVITLNQKIDGKGVLPVIRHFTMIGRSQNSLEPYKNESVLDNLSRLGILSIPSDKHYTEESAYEQLENDAFIKNQLINIEKPANVTAEITRQFINLTDFGKKFIDICIKGSQVEVFSFPSSLPKDYSSLNYSFKK